MTFIRTFAAAALAVATLLPPTKAHAELVLSQLVVDLQPGKHGRQDIEVINSGSDVLYIAVEPREVLNPGASQPLSRQDPDPEQLGLLVSPARMVLDTGQRKLLRIAAISGPLERERVYRVTVKPVVGELSSEQAGLKILVGYDVLVLVRPRAAQPQVVGTRAGNVLTLRNNGNVSVELMSGKQCDSAGKACQPLAGGRLYAGAQKIVTIDASRRASYVLKLPDKLIPTEF